MRLVSTAAATVLPLLALFAAGRALASDTPPRVVATIKPIHALVAGVMAGVGAPVLLVEGQASPHSFALKPSGARAVADADILFRVSEVVEPFTVKLAESLADKTKLVTLAEVSGVSLLERRFGATFEPHEHHRSNHDTAGPEAHEAAHHDHDHSNIDGHVWLDPGNAGAMVDAIVAALSRRDTARAVKYAENGRALKVRLDTLAAEIERDLAPVRAKPFVVFHDAAQYFDRRFGLSAAGSLTVSPEVAPSARRLSQVRARISALGARCVMADPQSSPRLVAAVTEGTGARTGVLDAEGALVEPPGPDLYFALLSGMAAAIKACLAD